MPGIFGIIGRGSHEEKDSALQQMMKCMMHESSYTSGSYINKQLGLCVGWICHAGSFTDCMPVWNETKDVCVIFSGEDFTDPTEIEGLRTRGHACNLEDASYLVHLYEEMGLKFIERLNGWFSGVLVDLREQSVMCSMTVTDLAGFIITKMRMDSIFLLRPNRFSRFYRICAAWILQVWQRHSPVVVCCRTEPSFPGLRYCQEVLCGSSTGLTTCERILFQSRALGGATIIEQRGVLRKAERDIRPHTSKIFSREETSSHVSHGRLGWPHDYGLGESTAGEPTLLYFW